MNHLQLAFFIGLFGSLHCVGMCGPLAFAIPNGDKKRWLVVIDKLIYQLGRAISYAFLGLLVGMLGKRIWIAGFQQTLSVVCGLVIVVYSIIRLKPNSRLSIYNFPFINNIISKAIRNKYGHFIIGVLNGFLPCAFVYIALATAINSTSAYQSALFMFCFGLGTLPLMFAAAVGVSFAGASVRKTINNILPILSLFLGIWFILRGLSLDIPFLSPVINGTEAICR
ncbi:sulfite exporter TauE/SafE family protein [Pseudopedobacter beijingensis]|uniref:Sulfite exporter TauE/SafE family protein n=1 Tax=Pseudopedobacter beijingensis TaxID=1207056 RepID=A0ABW4IBM0_9SPHI